MVIGRFTDRNKPAAIHGLRQGRRRVGTRSADPIWASGLYRPHQQAGHMTASNRSHRVVRILADLGPSTYGWPDKPPAQLRALGKRLAVGVMAAGAA